MGGGRRTSPSKMPEGEGGGGAGEGEEDDDWDHNADPGEEQWARDFNDLDEEKFVLPSR